MPPRGGRRGPPRKQYQRGEEVFVVGDANNPAFKATASNSRKRSIQPQRSIEHDAIEIVSDDEPSQPPRKSRPSMYKVSIIQFWHGNTIRVSDIF